MSDEPITKQPKLEDGGQTITDSGLSLKKLADDSNRTEYTESTVEILPMEMLLQIANYLTAKDLTACTAVCWSWHELFNRDEFWRPLCDPNLEEYLRTTPCVVEPGFVSPECEEHPLGQWRMAFMREHHLWNNWKQRNFKEEYLTCSSNETETFTFLTNDYMLMINSDSIDLYDVKEASPIFVTSTDGIDSNGCTLKIVKDKILLKESYGEIIMFEVDINAKSITKKLSFYVNKEPELLRRSSSDSENCDRYLVSLNDVNFAVIESLFLGIVCHESQHLLILNLESGEKIREEPCPDDKSRVFVALNGSETTENVIVVAAKIEKHSLDSEEDDFDNNYLYDKTYYYYVYSQTCLEFLPFRKQGKSESPICAILSSYVAIYGRQMVYIYNYYSSQQIFSLSFDINRISVLSDHFFFESFEEIRIFSPFQQTLGTLSSLNKDSFSVVSDKCFTINSGDKGRLKEVWRFDKILRQIGCSYDVGSINKVCTKVISSYLVTHNEGDEDIEWSEVNFKLLYMW